jgi:hypothetical protein
MAAPDLRPEFAQIFLRAHTRVKNAKPRGPRDSQFPTQWAKYALVFDCETTVDIRQDLTFLWWRFCELKDRVYVCQQEGVVYADGLPTKYVKLIDRFARNDHADVEEGSPTEIAVESRTEFVDGHFWQALSAGAVIVCFNAPFDLSRLALEYRPAQAKSSGGQWFYGNATANPMSKSLGCVSNQRMRAQPSLT